MSEHETQAIDAPPDWWPRKMLNEFEAADLLGVKVTTLRDWRCRRLCGLPYTKLNSAVRYSPTAVWAWLQANQVAAEAVPA